MAQYKLQISVPPSLMHQVDDYIQHMGLNRSGFFAIAAASYLNAHRAADAMEEVAKIMNQILASIQNGDDVSPDLVKRVEEISQAAAWLQDGIS